MEDKIISNSEAIQKIKEALAKQAERERKVEQQMEMEAWKVCVPDRGADLFQATHVVVSVNGYLTVWRETMKLAIYAPGGWDSVCRYSELE